MYADRMIPRGFKRPVEDRLGASFSRSPASGPGILAPVNRQRQDIINWNNSSHGDNRHVAGTNVHKDLKTSGLQKEVLISSTTTNKINSATEIQKKALGIAEAAAIVYPGEAKARPATELISAKKHAFQSPSAPKAQLTVTGFLQKLGLSKYLLTFQAEEVDMFALRHMNDDDLKSIGLPMGPRKKILIALAPLKARK